MSLSKSVNLTHAQTHVPCDACEDEEPGEYYCKECKQTLCPQCEKYHRKFTKDHDVVARSEIGDVDSLILSCADHVIQATVHCEKCNVPACIKCVTGKHQGHKMVDLAEISEQKRKLLQNHIDEMQEFLPKLARKRKGIELDKENYELKVLQITKDMEAENQSLHKELDRIYNERLTSLNNIRQSHLLMFDGYTTEIKKKEEVLEKRKSEYRDVIGKKSLTAIIKFVPKMESLPELGSTPELPEPPSFLSGNIQKVAENLGTLQLSRPSLVEHPLKQTTPTIMSKFICPLKGWPSICITKEGDVWLGGRESRELLMMDINGKVCKRRIIQDRPHALAAMNCGDIVVSPHPDDSVLVSRLDSNGRVQHLFDTFPSFSNGVSVTADQQILICMSDGGVVRTNGEGANVKQLYKASGDGSGSAIYLYAVENADSNICISNCTIPAVVIVSNEGKVLSTIKHTTERKKLGRPLGLAMDKMGNILCADMENQCVHIIDQNQQMSMLVGRSHGIQKPRQVAVDSDNNLWITEYDSTIHVIKYIA